ADELARFIARGCEAHAVDHVIEPAFQQLQERCARSTRTASSLDVVIPELSFKYPVHAAQLLLLAQLYAIVGQAPAALALDAARGLSELAFLREGFPPAFKKDLLSCAAGRLALGPEKTSHESPSTPAASWAGGSRCAGSA